MEFEINQGAYNISCPDAQCPKQGIIQLEEIEALVSIDEIEKHNRYRLNKGKINVIDLLNMRNNNTAYKYLVIRHTIYI